MKLKLILKFAQNDFAQVVYIYIFGSWISLEIHVILRLVAIAPIGNCCTFI